MIAKALFLWAMFVVHARAGDYLRITDGPRGERRLEVAAKSFAKPGETNAVLWLVGVSHIGSTNYYAEIQALLNGMDLVLYEGVDGGREEFRNPDPAQPGRGGMQVELARSLGLAFQLHAMDYNRPNFTNSDVSGVDLMALFAGDDPEALGPEARERMESLLASMEMQGAGGLFLQGLFHWVAANPGLRGGLAYLLVEVMGNLEGDIAAYHGLPADIREVMDVLIRRRNEVVLRDVAAAMEGDKGVTAVFYGAAHMHDLELRLAAAHGLEARETRWLAAFGANINRSGLNSLQKNIVRWFVAQQVETLRRMKPAPKPGGPQAPEGVKASRGEPITVR